MTIKTDDLAKELEAAKKEFEAAKNGFEKLKAMARWTDIRVEQLGELVKATGMPAFYFTGITPDTTKKEKVGSYKTSRPIVDNRLKDKSPVSQIKIFDQLMKTDQEKLKNVQTDTIIEGLDLTPAEDKLVSVLSQILFSQIENQTATNIEKCTIGEDKEKDTYEMPCVEDTLYQIAKLYYNTDTPSGAGIEDLLHRLEELSRKDHYMTATRTYERKSSKGRTIERTEKCKVYQKLLTIFPIEITDEDKEKGEEVNRYRRYKIIPHPFFLMHIGKRYYLYPKDYIQRIAESKRKQRATDTDTYLIHYLNRERGQHRTKPEILLPTLLEKACKKEIAAKRINRAGDKLLNAIKLCLKIELLESFQCFTTETGEIKLVFHINKNWA
jgi:hypothetical protein